MSFGHQVLGFGSGGGVAGYNSSDYNGTTAYAARGSALTGAVNSKKGILSFWTRIDAGDGTVRFVLLSSAAGTSQFTVRLQTNNKFLILGENTGSSTILNISSTTAYTASATWLHFLSSWDLAISAEHLYITDSSDLTVTTSTNDTLDYNEPDFAIGSASESSATLSFNGCLSELYFNTSEYLDFSIEGNRRKFIDSHGLPVFLGGNGGRPTGSQPIIYIPDGDPSTNKGSGGDFTSNNLAVCSNSPR